MSDKLKGHELPSFAAHYNKEESKILTCGQSVIGFLLLISASAHRQFVDTRRNILRSPASKEADTGGGTNGYNALKPLRYLERRPQALKRIREEEQVRITLGNLLQTYTGNVGKPFRRRCR